LCTLRDYHKIIQVMNISIPKSPALKASDTDPGDAAPVPGVPRPHPGQQLGDLDAEEGVAVVPQPEHLLPHRLEMLQHEVVCERREGGGGSGKPWTFGDPQIRDE